MSVKIDLLDKKLLFELDMNGRATNSELAKKLKISKQAVQYRISNLEKKGIIKGFYTAVDLSKIGFLYVRLFVKLKDTNAEIEKEIIDYTLNDPHYGWVLTIDGIWNFAAAIIVRDYFEVKEVVEAFLAKYGNYVDQYDISIATAIDHLQNSFLLQVKKNQHFSIGGRLSYEKLDKLDTNILLSLATNARTRLNQLAENVGESYKVISYRIKSLIEKGIIKKFRVDLNYNLLGYTHYKVFIHLKDFTPDKINKLKAFIELNKNTIYVTHSIGLSEIEFEAVFDDYYKMRELLQEIKLTFSSIIKDHYYVILYKFYQKNYLPYKELAK